MVRLTPASGDELPLLVNSVVGCKALFGRGRRYESSIEIPVCLRLSFDRSVSPAETSFVRQLLLVGLRICVDSVQTLGLH
jgi:hypothetical protein